MVEPEEGSGGPGTVAGGSPTTPDAMPESAPTPDSLTRGFLFADLRGYTKFVETHGASTAADLLVRYRALVREAVARYRGSEIGTEGDGFFIVFPAVSAAVQCGLAIVDGARRDAADAPGGQGINVGVGIHAGETVDTPDGYVGSAVNIAARICAIASPGQVFVSDTVRALTQSVVPVTFTPVGRRQLKGVREPLTLYAATAADPGAIARAAWRHRRFLMARAGAVAAVVVLLAAGAVWWQTRPPAALPPGPWTIGMQVGLAGGDATFGQPQVNAVKLAIDEANAGGVIGGPRLVLDARDEGQPGDKETASVAVKAWVADPRVLAIVGPYRSPHAEIEIPITNAAGLLECSPANTRPDLTKPRFGALDLRAAYPTRINYVRLATVDDIQGPAAASFAFHDLGARRALVIDDAGGGREVADSFQASFEALGGTAVRRALNPGTTDFSAVLAPLKDAAGGPIGAVFFGGVTDEGAPGLRQAMRSVGSGGTPLLSWDGLLDGSGADDGSYIQLAGAAASPSYVTTVSIAPVRADFDARYRAAFTAPPDQYAGAAYACAQIIIDGLRAIAPTGPDASALREALRASVVDPSHRYDTALGNVGFDANGDSIHQFVTFYKTDLGALGGKGDWIFVKEQDFGPTP